MNSLWPHPSAAGMRTLFTFVAMVGTALWLGCGLPSQARTGHTLRPGDFQFGGFVGGTFGSEKLPDAALETMGNVGFAVRAGVVDRCDASAELSVMRLGGHFRCSVLSEHHGAPLSVTPGAGVAFLPRRGPELVASVDLGKGADWTVAPLVNLEISRGTHFHFERLGGEEEEALHPEQSHYRQLARKETRLRSTFGFGVRAGGSESASPLTVGFGVSPYWLLAGEPELVDARMDGVTWSLTVGSLFE